MRHGASAPAVAGAPFPIVDGHSDPPLSEDGVRQAERLAERLADEPFAAIFVSGLRRTVETAAPLAGATGLEPVTVLELREVNMGEWEGGEWRVRLAQRDPQALRVLEEERWELIPGAESTEQLGRRVRAGIESIVSAVGPAVAAVFVHGAVIGELCRQATASRPFAFIHSDNASISRLVVLSDGRWLLRSFNESGR